MAEAQKLVQHGDFFGFTCLVRRFSLHCHSLALLTFFYLLSQVPLSVACWLGGYTSVLFPALVIGGLVGGFHYFAPTATHVHLLKYSGILLGAFFAWFILETLYKRRKEAVALEQAEKKALSSSPSSSSSSVSAEKSSHH
jgi:hypothetical protein